MKITITPTGNFHAVKGVECRVWKGKTDKGGEVELFIALLRAPTDDTDTNDYVAHSLKEVKVARRLVSFDYWMVT